MQARDKQTFKETYERIRARPSVKPQSQWRLIGVMSCFEEPEEHMSLFVEVNIT